MYFCIRKHNNYMSLKPSKILVPIGFSEQSIRALHQALNFAQINQSKVFLLTVLDERSVIQNLFLDDNSHEIKMKIHDKLSGIINDLKDKYSVVIEPIVSQGKIYDQINEVAEMISCDLIIMGTNGSPKKRIKKVIGSNAERVVRLAHCPVITIRELSEIQECNNIILPLDLDKETKEKVTYALEYARSWKATIRLVSVVIKDNTQIRERLLKNLNQVEKFILNAGVSCTTEIIDGDSKQNMGAYIFEYEKKFNDDIFMIMTKKEELSLSNNISVTARYIINNSPIPVMCIRPAPRKHLTGPTTAF